MLAKVPPKRGAKGSSFGELIRYLVIREGESREVPDAAQVTGASPSERKVRAAQMARTDPVNLTGEALRVVSGSGVVCQHNCLTLRTSGAEMTAVSLQNARVRDPVYHVVLSWPSGEVPSDDQAFASACHAIAAVGMAEHQYVFAVHRDTDNVHVHIAVNRVHPQTYRAVYPDRDYFKLDRAMRELELHYGWQHDPGPYAVVEIDGECRIEKATSSGESKGKLPQAAADMQRHSERESLFSYARGEPRHAIVAALKNQALTWEQLHHELGRYGLALKEKGRGLAIFDLRGDATAPIKASDLHEELSRARLERRLGAFVPVQELTTAVTFYDRFRPPAWHSLSADPGRQARADQQRELRARYVAECRAWRESRKVQRAHVTELFADIRRSARRKRLAVRKSGLGSSARKARYSVIAFETAREMAQLRQLVYGERYLSILTLSRPPSFSQWANTGVEATDVAVMRFPRKARNSLIRDRQR